MKPRNAQRVYVFTNCWSMTTFEIQVSAEGVAVEGTSTSLGALRRVTLRVSSSKEGREGLERVGEAGTDEGGKRGASSVDMGDWGVRVSLETVLALSCS